ncbi:MAG: hypothetical protein K2P81_03400 [Bacteriovoracaceae bacterium]|nr:hypothetical protein [Bacteriovoracaceae bacterium]
MRFAFILFFSLYSQVTLADKLTLVFARSPLGINWATPNTLAVSTVKNSLVPMKRRAFSISHVFVGLKCDSINYERLTGMTSAPGTEDRDLLFKQDYGFGVLFHSYRGHLETHDEVVAALESYQGSKRIAKLHFGISSETCLRLKTYLEEYEARGFGSMYSGLQARPLKGEGSGCSAFGMSFLETAGLLKEEYKELWMEKIHVPKRFVGGPLTGKRVSFFKIITSVFARWNPNREHIYLEAWNPEKMWSWVRKMHQDVQLGKLATDIDWQVAQSGNTRELYADMSHIPTPTGPIWQY